MAKSSVISKLKSLPKNRRNTTILENMTDAQRQLFHEWLAAFLATPIRDQPSYDVLAEAMSNDIKYPISKTTLAKHIHEKRRK